MRIFATAVALAFLPAPAHAQFNRGQKEESPVEKIYQNKLKEQAEIDRQYQHSVGARRSNAGADKSDPWANIRPANPPASNKPAR